MDSFQLSFILFDIFLVFNAANGHGCIISPAARNTMWRYGYNNPQNYDDNQLYCGGVSRQWFKNQGKCGECGDAYDGVRYHEAGGTFANGIITGTYREGETIDVTVFLTVNHQGYFEFRLCPVNNYRTKAAQECFDRNLLSSPNGQTRHSVLRQDSNPVNITIPLVLPRGTTCTQCVLQWSWNTGNSWGCEDSSVNGDACCIGCGKQEQYRNCADISIGAGTPSSWTPWQPQTEAPVNPWSPWRPQTAAPTEKPNTWLPPNTRAPTESPNQWLPWQPQTPQPTRRPWRPITNKPTTKLPTKEIPDWLNEVDNMHGRCRATVDGNDEYNQWCVRMCFQGVCPTRLCNDECREAFKDKIRYT